jgi:hypothetical protein
VAVVQNTYAYTNRNQLKTLWESSSLVALLPVPLPADLDTAMIADSTTQGVARQNRIILGGAKRFVFSRQAPPPSFIAKYFGEPAPKNIGYWITDDRLQTCYDPSRQ